jgi:hypothetical protein
MSTLTSPNSKIANSRTSLRLPAIPGTSDVPASRCARRDWERASRNIRAIIVNSISIVDAEVELIVVRNSWVTRELERVSHTDERRGSCLCGWDGDNGACAGLGVGLEVDG